jgi:predicted RNase H-like HicB family nuclease
MHKYLVVIENAGSNYSAYSPDLPGCVATGDTPEDAKIHMSEAIHLHVSGLREDHLPVPEPSSVAEYVEV